MRTRILRVLGLTLLLSIVFVAPASAYLDPGTTTVVFQAVIAAVAAAGFSLRMFWGRITAFFGRDSESADVEPTSDDASDGAATSAS